MNKEKHRKKVAELLRQPARLTERIQPVRRPILRLLGKKP
jgi:hypothetical protein